MAREFVDDDLVETRTTRDAVDTAVRHEVHVQRYASGLGRDLGDRVVVADEIAVAAIRDMDAELTEMGIRAVNKMVEGIQTKGIVAVSKASAFALRQLEGFGDYEARFQTRALKARMRKGKALLLDAGEAYGQALMMPIPATGRMLERYVIDWSAAEVRNVGDAIRRGWANGLSNQQLVAQIRGTKARGYKDGLVAITRRNAEMVARTAVSHVANTARNETYAANADVLSGWRFLATLDNRTTSRCRSLDQTIWKLGEGPRLPLHPGERSTPMPELDAEYAWLSDGGTRAARGPSGRTSDVPAEQTYYAWLKNQPAEFQDTAIGPERAQLLRDGGLSAEKFAKLNLGRNFEPLTLDEMRRIEPAAFRRAGL